MNLFKKIFSQGQAESLPAQTIFTPEIALDEAFVQHFIDKGGKFLYCVDHDEAQDNLVNIAQENTWDSLLCLDEDLQDMLKKVDLKFSQANKKEIPFLTFCEHLIAEEGSIMFSSEQVFTKKIESLPDHFIVLARTSQLVRNKGEALMGIRQNYRKNFPTNISSIKSYRPEMVNDDFLSFGNNNAKKVYLLLLEDL